MQGVRQSAAVFCIACICAEILAQMTERGWTRDCIKTVAGLYILLVFWNALPKFHTLAQSLELPQTTAVEMGSWGDLVRTQTEIELEQTLAEQCAAELGVSVQLSITLEETSSGETAASVQVILPEECDDSDAEQVSAFLEEMLHVSPTLVWESEDRGAAS